ncbi:hypothetical protein EIP86_006000 [Pleurotus ostreatoroseus]|nr:hypothetical protein EIP86_006000 [Pleurotus ostreatoroseus]
MVKSKDDVISDFNILTNMSVDELQSWVDNPQSEKAGTGVGLESAHKIIGILKKNPSKDPEQYDEEDIEHMRKVVAYDKRHLAQEAHLKDTKSKEELENAKSTIRHVILISSDFAIQHLYSSPSVSLKNWGHDPLKPSDKDDNTPAPPTDAGEGDPAEDAAQPAETSVPEESEKDMAKKTGEKRKLEDKEEEEDKDEADAEGVDDEPEKDEQDGEGARARKKSKTGDAAEKDEAKDDNEA